MKVKLDAADFRKFIITRKKQYNDLGSYPSVVVLCDELEDLVVQQFFSGNLSDLVTFNTDRHGKVRMYLAGIKTMFTKKLDLYHSIWVLDAQEVKLPDGTVSPTNGPGSGPDGWIPPGGGSPATGQVVEFERKAA